jgi:hypothetical protein
VQPTIDGHLGPLFLAAACILTGGSELDGIQNRRRVERLPVVVSNVADVIEAEHDEPRVACRLLCCAQQHPRSGIRRVFHGLAEGWLQFLAELTSVRDDEVSDRTQDRWADDCGRWGLGPDQARVQRVGGGLSSCSEDLGSGPRRGSGAAGDRYQGEYEEISKPAHF